MDEYPKVAHSHIVPAGYLKAWAVGKQVRAHRQAEPAGRLIGYRDAGVRTDFYRRERPATGEPIYDVEWTLQQLENRAIPVLDAIRRGEWPLSDENKLGLASLMAVQLLRGPAFKHWHTSFVASEADRLHRDGALDGDEKRTPEEVGEDLRTALTSSTERLRRMLNLSMTVAEIMAAMRWDLVTFPKPCLATSDEPVVVWPLARGAARPQKNDTDAGVLDTYEMFVPVSPDGLLLLTWQLGPDPALPTGGLGKHAATANAFTLANADVSWFSYPAHPAFKPGRGNRAPLSASLIPTYDTATALTSPLRSAVSEHANRQVGRQRLGDEELSLITLRPT